MYISSSTPQRIDGHWHREAGGHYRIEYAGEGDYFVLKKGVLVLLDEEGVVRDYRRTHSE
jgi:hypothetical protein